jgi:hypothetical protein
LTVTGTAGEAQLLGTWEPRPEKAAEEAAEVPAADGAPGRLVTVWTGPASGVGRCGADGAEYSRASTTGAAAVELSAGAAAASVTAWVVDRDVASAATVAGSGADAAASAAAATVAPG